MNPGPIDIYVHIEVCGYDDTSLIDYDVSTWGEGRSPCHVFHVAIYLSHAAGSWHYKYCTSALRILLFLPVVVL